MRFGEVFRFVLFLVVFTNGSFTFKKAFSDFWPECLFPPRKKSFFPLSLLINKQYNN
jgi:hypothetical protein